jgi:hypothetical protein
VSHIWPWLKGSYRPRYEQIGARKLLPFTEKDGQFWGLPANSEAAVSELQRMQKQGASFFAVALSSFWILDYYSEFRRYLETEHTCVLDTPHLIVIRLTPAKPGSDRGTEEPLVSACRGAGMEVAGRHDEGWTDMMFMLHAFQHPRYNDMVSDAGKQLPLPG